MRSEPKCVGHAEEKRKETSKAIRPMRAEERDFGWSKVKVSGLHLLWFDVKSVEGRKGERNKRERPFSHLGRGKKKWSPSKWDWGLSVVWQNCVSEWASKREKKNRESKRKLWEIHREKENSEWKEKESFFCSSCISKCCNLYLI